MSSQPKPSSGKGRRAGVRCTRPIRDGLDGHGPSRDVKGSDGKTYEVTRDLDNEYGQALDARQLSKIFLNAGKGQRRNTILDDENDDREGRSRASQDSIHAWDPGHPVKPPTRIRPKPPKPKPPPFQYSTGESEAPLTSDRIAEAANIDLGLHRAAKGFRFSKKTATKAQLVNMERLFIRFMQWSAYNTVNLYPGVPFAGVAAGFGMDGKRPERAARQRWGEIADELDMMGFHPPLSPHQLYDVLTIHMLFDMHPDSGRLAGPLGYRRDNRTACYIFQVARDRLTNAGKSPWTDVYLGGEYDLEELRWLHKSRSAFLIAFDEWRTT